MVYTMIYVMIYIMVYTMIYMHAYALLIYTIISGARSHDLWRNTPEGICHWAKIQRQTCARYSKFIWRPNDTRQRCCRAIGFCLVMMLMLQSGSHTSIASHPAQPHGAARATVACVRTRPSSEQPYTGIPTCSRFTVTIPRQAWVKINTNYDSSRRRPSSTRTDVMGLPADRSVGWKPTVAGCNGPVWRYPNIHC
jgi:hypothetical protein